LPPYIRPAYTWLLSNLHNPYPSKETKTTIAEESGSSPKDVDNWFINVRRRIGWNKLRSKHFENKRSLIVDAATRFFKEVPQALHSSTSSIDPKTNYDSEFKSIENTARDLYPQKLFETPLATKLDESGRDLTAEAKDRAQVECSEGQREAEELQRLYAYPTPERSPERSPEASAASLPIQDITPASSRKRRNPDRDSPDIEDCCDGPPKRCRYIIFSTFNFNIGIDSLFFRLNSNQLPVMTRHQITRQKNDCIIIPPSIPVAPSGKRKRRLSDAGYDGTPKRPHNALAVPRLQTVSDPFPLANPFISELYKTPFDQTISDSIPSPVSVESLDDTQVEVDFYNYDTSPDIIQSVLFPDSLDPFLGKFFSFYQCPRSSHML
jgi:C-terminal domain of homeodomain 1/Homeobox KN domain